MEFPATRCSNRMATVGLAVAVNQGSQINLHIPRNASSEHDFLGANNEEDIVFMPGLKLFWKHQLACHWKLDAMQCMCSYPYPIKLQ